MRIKSIKYGFILLFLSFIGLILVSSSVRAEEEYQLGVSTNLTLVYEITEVDKEELENLARSSEDDTYKDLAELEEGTKFKLVISEIKEKDDSWVITSVFYSGENLDQQGDDLESKVFKDPSDLADDILSEEDAEESLFYFLPVEIEDYLEELEENILEDDEYLEVAYDVYVDGSELTFDYTPYGYDDTIVQEYTEDGILDSYTVLSDDEEVFKEELVDSFISSEFNGDFTFIRTIVACSIVAIASSVSVVAYKKKKVRPESLEIQEKVKKMLKEVIQ